MKFRTTLLAAGMMAVVGVAQAQPVTGPYVGGGAGVNIMNNFSVNSQTTGGVTTSTPGTSIRTETGFAGVASLGWGFGNGFRAEVEGNYRTQRVGLTNPGTTVLNGGRQSTYGVMVNALYDFDIGTGIYPYVGAGVGYEWSALRGSLSGGGTGTFSDSRGNLGLQGIIGLGIPVGIPGLSVTGEYRFLARPSTDNNSFTGGSVNTAAQYNHSILVGLRYAFNVPYAAPVPAAIITPAPAPARTYLVFFDWDKSDLTARARQIIADAAQASTKVATTRIEVAGNADKTGTAAYNVALSKRRADMVAAELVRDGVAKSRIFVTANGDTRPIVPTAAGVREPQNRNVEIVLK